MAHPGILVALCAVVFAAVDGSAQTVPAVEASAAPCRFTLERAAVPADDDETWVLTCHHEPAAPVQPVVERRVVRPAAPQAATVTPAL